MTEYGIKSESKGGLSAQLSAENPNSIANTTKTKMVRRESHKAITNSPIKNATIIHITSLRRTWIRFTRAEK